MSRTVDIGPYIGGCLVVCAIKGSQYETIRWLWERRRYLPASAARNAAKTGDVAFYAWLMCQMPSSTFDDTFVFANACSSGSQAMARYLMEVYGVRPHVHGINYAARHGHMHLVRWLVEEEKVSPTDSDAILYAGYFGHRDIIEYLLEHGCPCPTSVIADLIRAQLGWGEHKRTVPLGCALWLVEEKGIAIDRPTLLAHVQRFGPADAWTIGDQALQDRLDKLRGT